MEATDVVQLKLAMLCCLKIHKCRYLLVPGYLRAFGSSSHLGERLLPQLCFWVIVYISSFSSQKLQESLCSGVGWSLVVWLGKSQINLCTVHMCITAHPLLL